MEGAAELIPPDAEPNPAEPSINRGASGFILLISVSMGMVAGGGACVLAAVLASGVFMVMAELGGRNFTGYFNSGRGAPASIGATISGVTVTSSSVFVLRSEEACGGT